MLRLGNPKSEMLKARYGTNQYRSTEIRLFEHLALTGISNQTKKNRKTKRKFRALLGDEYGNPRTDRSSGHSPKEVGPGAFIGLLVSSGIAPLGLPGLLRSRP